MDRCILHCDCNGFYASVECMLRPALKEVPMAVCGDPKSRHGIILAKNERAKAQGVQTAETIWQARKKCPDLVLVPPHRALYAKISRQLNALYETFTDQVEPFGIDESWLDVTGSRTLFGDGKQIADTLRARVREQFGLTISVGVSFNKIFAKLGSDYQKPDATTVILREDVERLVHPMPVQALLFVGDAARTTLQRMRIVTIGDLAHADPQRLVQHLGKLGAQLYRYANGLDDSPVARAGTHAPPKSIGNGQTFAKNLLGAEQVRPEVIALCDTVASRLRAHQMLCAAVQVTVKDPAFHVKVRQRKLAAPTHLARELAQTAMALLDENGALQTPVRMITITAKDLWPEDGTGQQISWFAQQHAMQRQKQEALERTLDQIRNRFGEKAILWGAKVEMRAKEEGNPG